MDERRRNQRLRMYNLSVDAWDGVGFLQGSLVDASKCGIGVAHFQKRRRQPEQLTLVISGVNTHFRMTVRARWSNIEGARRSVGGVIVDPPSAWTDFIGQLDALS